ncbi:MAG: hypothetical protein CMN76_06085 [Spirochaetaceae bacterium]|nr:hypothetical protein [Spirochaetaceae bacterium]|tara:strand:- start:251276 stop:254617 length:3342 start_codon:yes stop_codon:yes gene_type:complete
MLRRFLVFTLSLLALFSLAALTQDRLPEPYRIFPTFAQLLPSDPLRSFRPEGTSRDTEMEGSHRGEEPDRQRSSEKNKPGPDAPTEESEKGAVILDSGKDFAYLKPFFERLQNAERIRQANNGDRQSLQSAEPNVVRILHFGDSIMWGDNLSLKMKQLFQTDFGDGGRGLVNIIDSPSSELKDHNNETRRGFRVETIPFESFTMPLMPALGFSGGSARPLTLAAKTVHAIPESAMKPWSQARFILGHPERLKSKPPYPEINYTIDVVAEDSQGHPSESRTSLTIQDSCAQSTVTLNDARKIQASFSPVESGSPLPLIDGMFLETKSGVSYSAIVKMGIHLAWMQMIPEDVFQCGIRAAKPDLLIYQYGVNESASLSSSYRGFTRAKYEVQLRDYFQRIRRALPETAVLIVGPFERLRPSAKGPAPSAAQMEVREVQMQLAAEFGFAYFDAYEYLGGPGQMLEMVKNREAISDYTHLTRSGGDRLAQGIYDALITHYLVYSGNLDNKTNYSVSADFQENEGLYSYQPQSVTDAQSTPGAIAFHSMDFAYFLFVVVLGATILLRYPTVRLGFLIVASYYFYASWKLWPISLMLFSTVLDYFCARAIAAARTRAGLEPGNGRAGGFFLILSLLGNLGLLFFFKYFDFVAHLLNQGFQATGWEATVPALGLLLPVGISFYTFQTLSYTIDVYRGTLPMEKSFLRFSLYVTFFPQLVAGPIVRASEFIPEIKAGIYHFLPDAKDFNAGVFQFLGGLIKKMTADWLAYGLIDRVYQTPDMFTSAETLIVFYAYGLQIYGDFSGYTDMALGAARILGFNLTENFNRPYQSASISEFWRRWHISLGSWFRDYVYISLGGNRFYMYRNLFITMFLAGLWHGAGLMFVAWGIYHGLFLMLERVPDALRRRSGAAKTYKESRGDSESRIPEENTDRQSGAPKENEDSLATAHRQDFDQAGATGAATVSEAKDSVSKDPGTREPDAKDAGARDLDAKGLGFRGIETTGSALLWIRRLITLHLVLIGWVLFRSKDLDQFLAFFRSLFSTDLFSAGQWSIPNTSLAYLSVVALAYIYHLTPVRYRQNLANLWGRTALPLQILLAFLLILGLYQISVRDVQPFIYFQF